MKWLFVACLALCPLSACALEEFSPTPAELQALPQFCQDRIGKGSKMKGVASATELGRANYLVIHHYCFALNFARRAMGKLPGKDRNYDLGVSRSNYLAVIKAVEPKFWMRPQMYVELGRVYLQLKEPGEAAKWFNEAITFNPEYEPAYLALLDMNRASGQKKEGLEMATVGLRHLPESNSLKKAYREFGGKEPYPEPVVKAPPMPVEGTKEAEPAEGPKPPEPAQAIGDAATPKSAGVPVVAPAAPTSQAPASGCRFCTPEETQRKWRGTFDGQKN